MERIFDNRSNYGVYSSDPREISEDEDVYIYVVRSLIDDTVDYEETDLSEIRERNQKYYYGLEPSLVPDDEDAEYSSDPDDDPQQSKIVSTDVRDAVLTVLPELIRIFAASEHVVYFVGSNEGAVDLAKQATDYIRYKFWEECDGFMVLHNVFKDALTVRAGIATWWTDTSYEPQEQQFSNVSMDIVAAMMEQAQAAWMNPEIVDMSPPDEQGLIQNVTIKYIKSKPTLRVCAVPPDEFRISRRAKDIKSADCTGWERVVRAGDLIALGYDEEIIYANMGATFPYNEERDLRNPGMDTASPTNDLVLYGEWFIRIDADGDGINELHRICTVGSDHIIIDDYVCDHPKFALFGVDPRPHTAIGDALADLVIDIQDIKTNVLRGSLDSLAETINPRTVVNELLTNVEDAMSTDRGAVVRTRGDPGNAVKTLVTEFVGAQGFQMLSQLDMVKQQRTGLSEASKGIDPKAFQSTALPGIDAVITGAQTRIELIARILAETGLKDMFSGMLREIVANPNPHEVAIISGKYVNVNPSLFDPNMRCVVNPSLGKGSDMTRLMALSDVKNTQLMIIERFGVGNGIVGVEEVRNTISDMLAISNIKNVSRYFRELTPEQIQAIENPPKEPTPEEMIATAEIEKVKKDMVIATAKDAREEQKLLMDDDFRRDQLNVDSYLELASIFKDIMLAQQETETFVESQNEPPVTE